MPIKRTKHVLYPCLTFSSRLILRLPPRVGGEPSGLSFPSPGWTWAHPRWRRQPCWQRLSRGCRGLVAFLREGCLDQSSQGCVHDPEWECCVPSLQPRIAKGLSCFACLQEVDNKCRLWACAQKLGPCYLRDETGHQQRPHLLVQSAPPLLFWTAPRLSSCPLLIKLRTLPSLC